jgi:hypothetical protein
MRGLLFSFCVAAALGFAHADDKAPAIAPAEPPVQPSPPVDFTKLPWKDGESLTYVVSCYKLLAAQGTFVAHNKGDHWEYNLDLKSLGWVDSFYPFTGEFWSIMGPGLPWRSVEYGEYRFEPKRTIKERTRIDYAAHLGTREDWARAKTTTYPVVEDAIDDVGSMLYHLRTGDWKVGDRRTIFVYESDSEKQSNATCEAIETKAVGTYPAQSLICLTVIPGKGTHRKGHLTLWMTNDAKRLPLHAEMEFKYGTFDMDLTKTDKVATP